MEQQAREIDRTAWGPGPWDGEPDRVDFEHRGLPCLLLRNQSGVWCGYVAVPPGHPLHGLAYNECSCSGACPEDECEEDAPYSVLAVHGGLTYAGACQGHICHVPKPGEPDDVWWFGFDCNHAMDLAPAYARHLRSGALGPIAPAAWGVYRTAEYAREQTVALADQIAEWKAPSAVPA